MTSALPAPFSDWFARRGWRPRGHQLAMAREMVDNERDLHHILGQGLKLTRAGGGGEVTRFVCGYMSCDPQLSGTLLAGLPSIMKARPSS